MFSIPPIPETSLDPNQFFELIVPSGLKVLIADLYVENLGGENNIFRILEQKGPNHFEIRHRFTTAPLQVTTINFTTGLKLGDEVPIAEHICIENAFDSQARVLPRVNGIFVS